MTTRHLNHPRNLNDIIKKLGAAHRKKVEARAAQLIAEEMTLREIRKARKLTQQDLSNLVEEFRRSVADEFRSLAEVQDGVGVETHQSHAGRVGSDQSIGKLSAKWSAKPTRHSGFDALGRL